MQYMVYKTPACPGCGGDIAKEFTAHLRDSFRLPGSAGQFGCPICGHSINYILSEQVTVDVLPFKGES